MDKDTIETHFIYIRSNLGQLNRKMDFVSSSITHLKEQYSGDRGISFRLNKLEKLSTKRTYLSTLAGFLAGLVGYFSTKIGG